MCSCILRLRSMPTNSRCFSVKTKFSPISCGQKCKQSINRTPNWAANQRMEFFDGNFRQLWLFVLFNKNKITMNKLNWFPVRSFIQKNGCKIICMRNELLERYDAFLHRLTFGLCEMVSMRFRNSVLLAFRWWKKHTKKPNRQKSSRFFFIFISNDII